MRGEAQRQPALTAAVEEQREPALTALVAEQRKAALAALVGEQRNGVAGSNARRREKHQREDAQPARESALHDATTHA